MLLFLALFVFPFLQATTDNKSSRVETNSSSTENPGLSEVEISLASVTDLLRALMALHLCELLLSQAAQKVMVGSVLRLEELHLEQYNKELKADVEKRVADAASIAKGLQKALENAQTLLR